MDRNLNGEMGRSRPNQDRRRASVTSVKRKHKSMGPHSQGFKAVSPPFACSVNTLQQQQHQQEREIKRQKTKSKDVHTTHAPLSVPVSPSDMSTSDDSSIFRSLNDTTASDLETASHGKVNRQILRLSTSIISRRASSVDLSNSLNQASSATAASTNNDTHLGRHISAYLNVEGGSDIGDNDGAITTELSRKGEGSDCFRICIQTDDPQGETHSDAM